jgi:CTP synthase
VLSYFNEGQRAFILYWLYYSYRMSALFMISCYVFCYYKGFFKEFWRIIIMTKFIFVTGGVVSGLGKGITAASLGRLLKARGLKVAAQKLDPYINVDPGTMSPYQHGEVFVTDDGAETDLDLGHYERFIDEDLNKYSNLTTGKVYWNVLNKERRGEYLGETVQVIPHVTNVIKEFIYAVAQKTDADIVITEIGGTTGDIESQPFLEAIRQVGLEVGRENSLFIHVTLVPYLRGSEEHKSKPTQHSVKELQGMGINPNIIVLRCDEPIEESIFRKIAMFCNVKPDCVLENITIPILYEAPLMLEKSGFSNIVCRELGINAPAPDLTEWERMLDRIKSRTKEVRIGIVGKYVQLHDAYLSVAEALRHAGYENGAYVEIEWIDSETITDDNVADILRNCSGIVIPGGFGNRGIEGKIAAAHYCRVNNLPMLGICLGMQIAVIEFARYVCGLENANSGEFDEDTANKVIDFMPDQNNEIAKGGTMRLGAYPCKVKPGTKMYECYNSELIYERHRHRYEFNNEYRDLMQEKGLVISGTSPDDRIVETVEVPENDFYVGVQYHPEFKSRPNRAHALFVGLVKAALKH